MAIPLRLDPIPASFIVWQSGGVTYGRNLATGEVIQNADAATVIQAAINALTSGGKVFIRAGTYVIASTLVIRRDYLCLCGEGSSSLLQAASGLNSEILRISGGASYGEISHLGFNGNRASQASGSLIKVTSGGYGWIHHNYLYNAKEHAVHLHSTDDVVLQFNIQDNKGTDFEGDGIRLERGSYANEGHKITYNHLGGLSGSTGAFIRAISATELWIEGNTPVDWRRGVSIDDAYCTTIHIQNNVFDTMGREGIYSDGQEVWISHNHFFSVCLDASNTYDAIHLDTDSRRNFVLSNNFRYSPAQNPRYAIYSEDVGNLIFDNVIIAGAYVTGAIYSGTNNWVRRNYGYVTENFGTATILNGWATVYVPHGLAVIPTIVLSMGRHSETYDLICTARDATGISLQVSAPVTGDRTVDWYVEA